MIVNTNTAGYRLMWSMAKDVAFQFFDYFSVINPTFVGPLRAMIAILILDAAVGLLVLSSDPAFYAIIQAVVWRYESRIGFRLFASYVLAAVLLPQYLISIWVSGGM
jgi:hypothetical protein